DHRFAYSLGIRVVLIVIIGVGPDLGIGGGHGVADIGCHPGIGLRTKHIFQTVYIADRARIRRSVVTVITYVDQIIIPIQRRGTTQITQISVRFVLGSVVVIVVGLLHDGPGTAANLLPQGDVGDLPCVRVRGDQVGIDIRL